jgi:hypothetical protein
MDISIGSYKGDPYLWALTRQDQQDAIPSLTSQLSVGFRQHPSDWRGMQSLIPVMLHSSNPLDQ